jgi:HEAT repeat protein
MAREQLQALVADVDRLILAGGHAAVGDEGLRKRALALHKLRAKVPALARIVEVAEAALSGTAVALLNLLLLCRQTRAGMASAGVEGSLEPIPRSGPWETPAPALEVAEVADALSGTGPGRQVVLLEAVKRGIEPDLRLLGPSLQALQDRDGALADTVAQEVLPAFGGGVLDQLREGLDLGGKAPDARRLLAICKIAPDVGLELCREALERGSATVRLRALNLLAKLSPKEAKEVAVSLLEGKPKDWKLRAAAIEVVSRKPRRDERTIAVLLDALGDGWRGNPNLAANALGKIGKQVVPALIERLEHSKADVRLYAAWALNVVGPDAAPAVPHLIERIKDTAFLVPRWTIWALKAIGPKNNPLIVRALEEALTDRRLEVRVVAATVLAEFGRATAAIVAALIAALKADDLTINSVVRWDAIDALARLGPRAKAAVPALTALLNDQDSPLQKQMRKTLKSIQGKK